MNEHVEYVAEHIMRFERGRCEPMLWGGGSHSTSAFGKMHFESWSNCKWCGQELRNGEDPGPCPAYPFPSFTLEDLMRRLGDGGLDILVRVDPHRDAKRFTVVGPRGPIANTDEPFEALCAYLAENELLFLSGDDSEPSRGRDVDETKLDPVVDAFLDLVFGYEDEWEPGEPEEEKRTVVPDPACDDLFREITEVLMDLIITSDRMLERTVENKTRIEALEMEVRGC